MTTIYDLDTAKRQLEIYKAALEQYANPDNWQENYVDSYFQSPDIDEIKNVFSPTDSGGESRPGYELAQEALDKADKTISIDLWRHNV